MKRYSKGNVSTPAKRPRYTRTKRNRYASASTPSSGFRNMKQLPLVKMGFGFPKMLEMTHRYSESFIPLTSSSGSLAKYFFSCNGMYDPNITGTGHQPGYFDQIAAIYDHYTVIASKIKVSFVPGGTASIGFAYGVSVHDDATNATTNFTTLMESPTTVGKFYSPFNAAAPQITKNWNVQASFGNAPLANDELKGNSATNPFEQQTYMVWLQSTDGSTTSYADITVEITYTAIWRELKDFITS